MVISGHIHGTDERGRIIRRTLARYLLLLQSLCFQAISTSVRKRFPTLDHLVEAGLMTKEEKIAYDEVPSTHGKWWLPAAWFTNLTVRARKEGRIKDDFLMKQILERAYTFRSMAGDLFAYDWISIPLVYTQTVTIAVYTYFFATLLARQYLDPAQGYSGYDIDLYVPIFTILEFFFFMGWLKVAEQLINPFGEDDDDFELNWILDRNLVVSMIIVDSMYNKFPRLQRDSYWDESSPTLPYTKSSVGLRNQPYLGSAINLDINPEESEFIPPSLETIMEDEVDDDGDEILGQYITPPNSPNTELLRVDDLFNLDQEPLRRPPSSISQSALNMLPDFIGSRLNNMIFGSSVENVSTANSVSTLKPTGSEKSSGPGTANSGFNSLNASFSLKSPRRRPRKVSMGNPINNNSSTIFKVSSSAAIDPLKRSISSSLFSRDSVEDINLINPNSVNNYAYGNTNNYINRISPSPGHTRRSMLINRPRGSNSLSAQDSDGRSLIIDLGDGLSLKSQSTLSSTGQQQQQQQQQPSSTQRARPQSISMDESNYNQQSNGKYHYSGKGNETNQVDGNSTSVYESDLIDDTETATIRQQQFGSTSMLPPIPPPSSLQQSNLFSSTKVTEENTNNITNNQPIITKESNQQQQQLTNEQEGIYEPSTATNSSQESLSPGSNQSTVTSITQLISKSSEKES
ncbi:bestrophin-3-like isoform X2 [Panonychus citri]|nr:bestrophin-3-like isoform X2 [Panonychus citri]